MMVLKAELKSTNNILAQFVKAMVLNFLPADEQPV